MSEHYTGGCLCGAVKFAVREEPVVVALCHCQSCRRASAAPAVAWAMFPQGAFQVTQGELAVYASSPGVERGFCSACGTPVSYVAEFLPGLVDLTVGSFDHPDRLPPQAHIWTSHRLPWFDTTDQAPRYLELPPHEP